LKKNENQDEIDNLISMLSKKLNKSDEKRFVWIKNDLLAKKTLKHENNMKKRRKLRYKSTGSSFYLDCERCENIVSAKSSINKFNKRLWGCEEYCFGCSSAICYKCIPYIERYTPVNLGSKKIIRDPCDRRYNTYTSIDKINKENHRNYCECCAFEKLKNGECMIKVKDWNEK
jgi:hypothetical protein